MVEHETEYIKNSIISEFAKTIEMFDLTPLEARLFAYLYLSEEPKTLDDMSEALGKSKTSMSTNIRNLSDLNLVTLVWKKGVRKDLYQANQQLFKIFMTSYIRNWRDTTNHRKNALEKIKSLLVDRNSYTEEVQSLHNQLNEIIEFHTKLDLFFAKLK